MANFRTEPWQPIGASFVLLGFVDTFFCQLMSPGEEGGWQTLLGHELGSFVAERKQGNQRRGSSENGARF